MFQIPLFPLNTVLFPGMPLNLHIFEDRYKKMIAHCMEWRLPFGVVLIESGEEAGSVAASPYTIGCTASIHQMMPLAEGRMNILAVGQERFQIHSLDYSGLYLTGMVELTPFERIDEKYMSQESGTLRSLLQRYLTLLAQAENVQVELDQLPDDPVAVAYLSAFLLQVPGQQKQKLLGLESLDHLLDTLVHTYRQEALLLQALLKQQQLADQGPFSLN
jgi:uncharacterized protein